MLISSRASRVSDVLTAREVNEIADAPVGTVRSAVKAQDKPEQVERPKRVSDVPTGFSTAQVGNDGKVSFDAANVKASEKQRV